MYLLTAIVALISLFAPPVGVWLTNKNIWLPFGLAILLDLACYPFMFAVPETWRPDHTCPHSEPSREALLSEVQEPSPDAESGKYPLSTAIALFKDPNLRLCFIFFFLRTLALCNPTLIMQHASRVLGSELGETAWLLVIKSGISFLTTALVLPTLTSYLLEDGKVLPRRLDAMVVRTSLGILALGYLCIAEASGTMTLLLG